MPAKVVLPSVTLALMKAQAVTFALKVPTAGSIRRLTQLFLCVSLGALPSLALAGAPISVGDGTAASCTEAPLTSALSLAEAQGGGTIQFDCGEDALAIILTGTVTVPDNTTIDGDGRITLTVQSIPFTTVDVVVRVNSDTTAVIKNLSVRGGFTGVVNFGALEVHHSAFSAAILHNVFNSGTLTVHNSTFSSEIEDVAGGGILNAGMLIVHDSTFSFNFGGGISNEGTATIENSTFFQNQFPEFEGGGILNFGTLTVQHSTFSDNFGGARGGGIYNQGIATVRDCFFSGNDADFGGGIFNGGTLNVVDSTIIQNNAPFSAGFGGGIFNGGPLTIANSIITQNTARSAGGGIYTCVAGDVVGQNFGVACDGTLTLSDTSVTLNTPDNIFP